MGQCRPLFSPTDRAGPTIETLRLSMASVDSYFSTNAITSYLAVGMVSRSFFVPGLLKEVRSVGIEYASLTRGAYFWVLIRSRKRLSFGHNPKHAYAVSFELTILVVCYEVVFAIGADGDSTGTSCSLYSTDKAFRRLLSLPISLHQDTSTIPSHTLLDTSNC